MKRWVWLILLAFGTMLTHVPAVELPLQPEESSCCGCEGKCAMPDCAPAPGANTFVMERSAPATRAVQPAARNARRQNTANFSQFDAVSSHSRLPQNAGADVPVGAQSRLFERYCSWLI